MKKPANQKAKKTKGRKLLADEDHHLWHTVTQSVTPLRKNRVPAGGSQGIGIPEVIAERPRLGIQGGFRPIEPKRTLPVNPTLAHSKSHAPNTPLMTHESAPGLDRRTKARMKRGKIDVESRLDLHGYYREQAQNVLESFISRAYHSGQKAVLVVTGKGLKEDGRIGVLRQAVPGWLNSDPLRHMVHAFSYASPRDGGQGALYILMKKKRTQTIY